MPAMASRRFPSRLAAVLLAGVCVAGEALAVTVPRGVELAKEQVLRRGNGAEPDTLDPHRSESTTAAHILRDVYEGLTGEAPDGAVVPAAAERWDISTDGTVYTFYLRKTARWSNGDPVTAGDFVAGLRRSVDPKTGSAYSQILAPLVNAEDVIAGRKPPESLGVDAIDDHTLRIRLVAPTPYLPGLLTHSATYPIHPPSLAAHGERFSRAGNMVGNGAFQLTEWVVNDHLTVERNPYYWDNANTVIDKVIFYPIEDQSTDTKRFRANEIDWTLEIPNSQFRWLKENLPKELHVAPILATYYYGFNLTRPPFKDNLKLRQALTMAVDRDILTEKVTGVGEVPAWSWVPPVTVNYTPQYLPWKDWPRDKRLAEARRLYKEAGYSDSNPLQVEIRYNTSENHKKIAIAIAQMWKQNLGVKAALFNEEWKVFLENRKQKQVTEVFRDGWNADYNDAYTFIELLHSRHNLNDPGYSNPRYDALAEKASRENDLGRRRALMEEAERIMLADYPMIPLYYYVTKRLVKTWVGGYRPAPLDHYYSKNYYIIKH